MALVLVVGVLSGLAGGLLALQLDDDEVPAPAPASTPAPRVEPSDADRLRDAIAEVSPAVVRIITVIGPDGGERAGTTSVGSGVIVDDRGLVLTNFHVIEGFTAIAVILQTGEQRVAQLVADDSPFQDIAFLRIEPGGLRTATIGNAQELRVGDPVVSISAGIGPESNQVKSGIISDLELSIERQDVILEDMIQTDAAVNIGDSGGALVNLDGEVIGLVTANLRVTPAGELIEGVGFAHSMLTIAPILESVRSQGFSERPRYGIERVGTEHVPIDSAVSTLFDLPVEQGAFIVGVAIGSPAEDGGVLPGDIVLAVNGVAVGAVLPLANLLKLGADVELTVLRDGEERQITVLPAPLVQGSAQGGGQ